MIAIPQMTAIAVILVILGALTYLGVVSRRHHHTPASDDELLALADAVGVTQGGAR